MDGPNHINPHPLRDPLRNTRVRHLLPIKSLKSYASRPVMSTASDALSQPPASAAAAVPVPARQTTTIPADTRGYLPLAGYDAAGTDLSEPPSALSSYTGSGRWMVPYADLLTVLMGLFLMLLAISSVDMKDAATTEAEATQQEALQAQLESALKPENTSIADPLTGVLTTTPDIQITHEARGLVISLRDSVLFEAGSAQINDASLETLDQVAEVLKSSEQSIRVEGHTDDTPISTSIYPSNWELSTARATQIVRVFSHASCVFSGPVIGSRLRRVYSRGGKLLCSRETKKSSGRYSDIERSCVCSGACRVGRSSDAHQRTG